MPAIQNPAVKLQPEEITEIVRYVIEDWKMMYHEAICRRATNTKDGR